MWVNEQSFKKTALQIDVFFFFMTMLFMHEVLQHPAIVVADSKKHSDCRNIVAFLPRNNYLLLDCDRSTKTET